MVIVLRLLAFVIDCCVCVFSILGLVHVREWIWGGSGEVGIAYILLWLAFFALWPFVYFGVPTGLWRATLGKFVCRLKVKCSETGFWRGLKRETLKLLTIFSVVGAFFCLFQVIHQGTTWYDALCRTRVEPKTGVALTKMQKRFRRTMKERQASREQV
ncbi:MAG: RDD family protein [Planctomycetota bacterium]